jgi:cytochrome P450
MFGGPNAGEVIGNPNVMVTRMVRATKARADATGAGAASGGVTGPADDLFTSFFSDRIAGLRRKPMPGDFLSDLVEARDDAGVALTDEELLSIIRHFRVAGHETSTKMLAAGMYNLIKSPPAMAAVRADLSLCANLVEESLRIESPVQALFRVANEDSRVGDTDVPAGSLLMLLYGAANRDPAQFADPETFDVKRENARSHLAFGQGPHYCIGAPFARAEGRIGFETVLSRTKEIGFVEDANSFERTMSYVLRGIRELYLRLVAAE